MRIPIRFAGSLPRPSRPQSPAAQSSLRRSAADLQRDTLQHTSIPPAWKAPGATPAPIAERWLTTFNDPVLSALVDEALVYNADLQRAAGARRAGDCDGGRWRAAISFLRWDCRESRVASPEAAAD
jgi:outer membrane protein TolC